MTAAIFFTALIPVALLGVLGLVVLSGKMSARARNLIERVLAVVLYGTLIALMTINAVGHFRESDWLMMLVMAFAAIAFTINGLLALRRGRVFGKGPDVR